MEVQALQAWPLTQGTPPSTMVATHPEYRRLGLRKVGPLQPNPVDPSIHSRTATCHPSSEGEHLAWASG